MAWDINRFWGCVINEGAIRYEVHMEDRLRGMISSSLCSGYARMFLTGKYSETNEQDSMAWGYEGAGPLHTAALITYYTLKDQHVMTGTFAEGYPWEQVRPLSMKEQATVHKFHTEVVANLPDNWEVSADEVRQWIRDGTLPSCIIKPKEEVK